jgi:inner membrane protein
MLWRTHVLAGACAGLLISNSNNIKTAAVAVGIAGISSLLPDIDSPDSKLGKMIPVLPWLLKATIGHRGLLHSLLGSFFLCGLIVFCLRFKFPYDLVYQQIVPLIGAGIISHLVMDSLTPGGCPWLWPWSKHFSVSLVKTGSLLERWVVLPGMVVLFAWIMFPVF